MIFRETFNSTVESEKEAQRFITYLKEHAYNSERHLKSQNYIKAYKAELKIESQLKALNVFFQREVEKAEEDLVAFNESVSKSCLKARCKKIEQAIQMFSDDDEEDFGDDD